jgi:HD-GYP domain-containing protein (c-di-GMP phosphodiesterase class II)
MLEIVAAHDVKLGMFVAELDRPWVGTPFALQGFLVSNERQLAALREYCRFVSVDRSRSTYTDFAGSTQAASMAATPRSGAVLDAFRSVSVIERPSAAGAKRPAAFATVNTESVRRSGPTGQRSVAAPEAPAARDEHFPQRTFGRVEIVREGRRPRDSGLPQVALADLERVAAGTRRAHCLVSRPMAYVDQSSVEAEMLVSGESFLRAQDLMLDVSSELAKDKLPQPERIREAVDCMVESVVRNPDALIWLSKLKRTDNYSYDHALDVSIHLMAFGRHLGFPADELSLLGVAGLLQDVGKVRIPQGLLHKAGRLTPVERSVLRRHVEFSIQILSAQPGLSPRVIDIVARHHERCDGSGYPQRLAGKDIGIFAEMAGLVDSYCAMSYERPYRQARDNQNVLHKLYESRSKRFAEPLVVEFIQCIGLYPVGTLVELRSGEVGVVVGQNRVRRLKPRVMVLLDSGKNVLQSPFYLDLTEDLPSGDGSPYQIRRALRAGSFGIEPTEFYL